MKRITRLGLAVMMALAATWAGAQTTSLGDYARTVRKQQATKPAAAKQYDNDNLPRQDKLSVVGPTGDSAANAQNGASAASADASANAGATAQGADSDKKSAGTQDTETAQRQEFYKEWQKKIGSQKEQVDLLAREMDVLQREYRLRAAAMYADAGNRLRNSTQWDKEDADYKQKMADKQKAIDDAKQKLDDMQEDARKTGVPSSMRE